MDRLLHTTSLTTSSPDALRAYLEGEALYRRADFAGASDAFRRAVALDSTFALAGVRLSRSLGWLRNIGDREAGEALELAQRAVAELEKGRGETMAGYAYAKVFAGLEARDRIRFPRRSVSFGQGIPHVGQVNRARRPNGRRGGGSGPSPRACWPSPGRG